MKSQEKRNEFTAQKRSHSLLSYFKTLTVTLIKGNILFLLLFSVLTRPLKRANDAFGHRLVQ